MDYGEKGFTLVELMIVVAIIGVLSAIAVPNFQKYQAKSKTSEAKLQLSAAYIAEEAFFGEYGLYARCLKYMGFDPSNEISKRYYMIGFNHGNPIIDATAYNNAASLGLSTNSWINNGCPDFGLWGESTFFLAGRGIGTSIMNNLPDFREANTGIRATIGTQTSVAEMTFTVIVSGYISQDNVTPTSSSVLSVNESKIIRVLRPGY